MGPGVGLIESRQKFVAVAGLAAIAALAFAAIVQFQLFGATAVTAIDDLGEAMAAFIAAAACAWAGRRATGNVRVGWTLMAISAALWGAGEVAWSVYEIGLGIDVPFPSWADAGFLAAVPFAVAAIRAFWTAPRGTASRWRVWLDGAIIAGALTFTGWAFGLRLVLVDPDDPIVEKAFELAYPVADILIGTILILAIRRATHQQQGRMILLLGGVAAYSLADSAFSYLTAAGAYGVLGNVIDAGWVVGYLMIALAAIWPASDAMRAVDRTPVDRWQVALPWLTVLLAGASALFLVLSGHELDLFLTALTGVGAGLLTLNMILTHRDFLAMLIKSQTSEATLAEVIDRAPAGVVRIGNDMRIIDANPRFKALLHTAGNQSGQQITRYFPESEAARFVSRLKGLQSGAEAVEDDSEAVRTDGSKVWVHWSATAVPNLRGGNDFFIAMFEDTTARHEAEAAAAASLEMMQRLNALKTEFLQNVSHEFKTALIGIQGFSEFMRDADQLDINDVRSFAADIHRDAERLDRMVTEMIALDHVETTRASLRLGPVDMNGVIEREVGQSQAKTPANIVVNLEANLPMVSGDEEKLGELVRILLGNSVMYSPEKGRVTVTTAAAGETVTVTFRDEGVGARTDFDNRLFGQNDLYANNPIRKVVGTGLQLSIARQVVEMHGGRLWVDSGNGHGSEFHFTLRAVAKPPANEAQSAGMVA